MIGHGIVAVLGNLVPKLLRYAALVRYANGVLPHFRAESYGIHNRQRKVYNLARTGADDAALRYADNGCNRCYIGAVGQGDNYRAEGLVNNAFHSKHAKARYLCRCRGRCGRIPTG